MPTSYPGLRAGQLRDQLIIQMRTDIQDGTGGTQPSYANVAKVWADVQPIEGFRGLEIEAQLGNQLLSSAIYRIIIRFISGITTMHRLIWIGPPDQPLDILSVQDMDGRRRKLSMVCRGGISDG